MNVEVFMLMSRFGVASGIQGSAWSGMTRVWR